MFIKISKIIRKMKYTLALFFSLALSATGEEIQIGQRSFQVLPQKIIEKKVGKPNAVFGVITDLHGHCENTKYFARGFLMHDVDGILVLGDIANRSSWYFGEGGKKLLIILAETRLPVYVLPGNHEPVSFYTETMKQLAKQYPNLIDLAACRSVDAVGVNFVSNPHGEGMHYALSGNRTTKKTHQELEQLLNSFSDDDARILLTHQPPKCQGQWGVDYTLRKTNDGAPDIDALIKKYKFHSLSGDIHSCTNGCDHNSHRVKENTFAPALRFTPGAALPHKTQTGLSRGNAGIITIKGKNIMYEVLCR